MLDDQFRVKGTHKIFWRKHVPIATYDNLKYQISDYVLLQKMSTSHCKSLCLSLTNV